MCLLLEQSKQSCSKTNRYWVGAISSESSVTSESDLSIAGSDWEHAEASDNISKEMVSSALQMLRKSPINMHENAMHQR